MSKLLPGILLLYSPVIAEGIPPLREGTRDFNLYWKEQRRRCLFGYQPTGGVWIPGNYYWHLNFYTLNRRVNPMDEKSDKKDLFPLYRDSDHEVMQKLWTKREAHDGGLIFGKARRKAFSDLIISHIMWELKFHPETNASIGVPNDDNLVKIMPKFETGWNSVAKPLYQSFLTDNKYERWIAKVIPTESGTEIIGNKGHLWINKFSKAGIWKGLGMKVSLIDEIGEFSSKPSLEHCYMANKDCWKEGDSWVGMPVLGGTSDQINTNNKAFKKMWYKAEDYGLERFFIPSDKIFGTFIDLSTGKSDRVGALKVIEAEREKLNHGSDKTALLMYMQDNPTKEEHMFMVGSDNDIDIMKVNNRIAAVMENPALRNKSQEGDLHWEVSSTRGGETKYTGRVYFTPQKGGPFIRSELPINHLYPNADIMTVDDYYKDTAPESDSLGGAVVYRRYISPTHICCVPALTYLARPPKRKDFHEAMVKMAVYSGAKMAIEYNDDDLYNYIVNHKIVNGRALIKTHPWRYGKIVKEKPWGYHVGEMEKPRIKLNIKMWVEETYINWVTDIRFLEQIAMFGDRNSDIGSAFGVALFYSEDMNNVPVRPAKDPAVEGETMVGFTMNGEGVPIQIIQNGGFKQDTHSNTNFGWQHQVRTTYN